MMHGHRIVQTIKREDFAEIIRHYTAEDILFSSHALFRLEEGERKVFKEEVIK